MPSNKYHSIPFSSGFRQDIPKSLLPLPFLNEASNLVIKDQGRIENRPLFHGISRLPQDAGKPLKLYVHKDKNILFCVTDRYILTYDKANNEWKDVYTNLAPEVQRPLSRKQNTSAEIFPLVQKEVDVKTLAFTNHGDKNLVFFYTLNDSDDLNIYYVVWSIPDKRVVKPQTSLSIETTKPIQLYALYNKEGELWLGMAFSRTIKLIRFDPIKPAELETHSIPFPRTIRRFKLFKDSVFYLLSSGGIMRVAFNTKTGITDKAQDNDVTELRDPTATATDISNDMLWDFRNWVDFRYNTQYFKMVWSLKNGYFLLNSSNKIISHLYANLLPESARDAPRVRYAGDAVVSGNLVYIPILRSGQEEVVNRNDVAVVDKQIPASLELVLFKPLGLELLVFDMESEIPPSFAEIGKQMMISGPVLLTSDGIRLSEYFFTERPTIKKTDTLDYIKWPYPTGISREAPAPADLRDEQRTNVSIELKNRDAPYLLNDYTFSSRSSVGKTGVGAGIGSWSAGATPQNRTLRYSSLAGATDRINESYGVLNEIYYDNNEKAIICKYTGVPTSLSEGKDHPQAITIAGTTYGFHSWEVSARTLTAYHFRANNPIPTSGNVSISQPRADVLRTLGSLDIEVQRGGPDNNNRTVKLNDVRFRKYERVTGKVETIAERRITQSSIQFNHLNQAGDRGAFTGVDNTIKNALRTTLGVTADRGASGAKWTRDTSQEFNLAFSGNYYAICYDGTTLYVVDNPRSSGAVYLWAYNPITKRINRTIGVATGTIVTHRARDSFVRDALFVNQDLWYLEGIGSNQRLRISWSDNRADRSVDLPSGDWQGLFTNGTIVWALDSDNERALAFSANNGFADSSNNIDDTGDAYEHGFTDGTTRWLTGPFASGDDKFNAYNVTTGRRDSDLNFNIGVDFDENDGIAYDGANKIWMLNESGRQIRVYTRTPVTGIGNGTIQNSAINDSTLTTNINLVGLWNSGNKHNLAFGGLKTNFAGTTDAQKQTDLQNKILTTLLGRKTYTLISISPFTLGTVQSSDIQRKSDDNNVYIILSFDLTNVGNTGLKNIVESDSVLSGNNLKIDFYTRAGANFKEDLQAITNAPENVRVVYSTFTRQGQTDTPSEIQNSEPLNNVIILTSSDNLLPGFRAFTLNRASSFVKIKGPVSGNFYYNLNTTDEILNKGDLGNNLNYSADRNFIFSYPLEEVATTASFENRAWIYNYIARFKWIDENGNEFRSPYSPVLQLLSTRAIGAETDNQPTFELSHLNLTEKSFKSVKIEIYRTKRGLSVFHLVGEISSNKESESSVWKDDKIDDQLGAPVGNNELTASGARFVIEYKGRFVLYGFPDNPNRILISSPHNPFSNQAVAFQFSGGAGNVIEILMEDRIVAINVLDSSLIIFTTAGTYVWTINDQSITQEQPALITGLGNYTVDNYSSSVITTEGLFFNSDRGRGIQMLTRGLSWRFAGEPVKKATRTGKIIDTLRKDEDIIFIKEKSTDDPQQPQILVYNQHYKQWTSYSDQDIVSAVIYDKRFTAITTEGILKQEIETTRNPQEEEALKTRPARQFTLQTGWINLLRAFAGFQRLRDVYLLAEFTGLESLTLQLDYDFIPGFMSETINYNLAGYTDPPAFDPDAENIGTPVLPDRRDFRFQPRQQGCKAVRLKFTFTAKTAKMDSITLGGVWQRLVGAQTQVSSQVSAPGPGS